MPDAVKTISRLITPLPMHSVVFGLGLHDRDDVFQKHPRNLLELAEEAIDLNQEPPFDLEEFLDKITSVDPSLRKTWQYRKLRAALRGI
ncbi:hypothetical protein AMST5_03021 [freshwater sediment metagenome]|uniref:Uncharacterized protein n=1 Tax=freshwater sediment metagenome TaxID=556182 RepID=A0AA48RF15_9ZZZZ